MGSEDLAIAATEAIHPDAPALDLLEPAEVVRLIAREERRSAAAVERAAEAIGRLASLAANAISAGGRLIFVGAGTSGRLGALEAAECPPTFGSDPKSVRAILAGGRDALESAVEGAEDRVGDAIRALDAETVGPADLLVAISASGRTPFVRAALEEAARRGARTALITCNPSVEAERRPPAEIVAVLDVGPELLAGSTRMKGGTATKMALNALTTAAFSALGKVYGNFMVDLRTCNAKLEGRARRIVQRLCGLADEEEAARVLAAASGRVKEAVVMRRRGVGLAEAERLLCEARGSLRRAIG